MTTGPLLGGVAVLALAAETIAHDSVLPALAVTAFAMAVAALGVLVVLPRVDPSAHPILGVSFGISALFTTIAFWSALPFGFGAAAIAASGRVRSVGGVLAILAMLIASVFCMIV